MKQNARTLGLLLLCIPLGTFAQDTLQITQAELLQKTVEKNIQLKIAQQNNAAAKADYRQTNALFMPSIAASYTGISTTNPLMAFGSKLNQEILSASDFNPDLLNNPTKTKNFATKIEVLQPLINSDGWLARKAAYGKMDAYVLQTARYQEYLNWETSKAYRQLQLSYKALAVMQKAKRTVLANLKTVQHYFAQGLIQKTDVLAMQIRVNEVENQVQFGLSSVQNASDYLAFLMDDKNQNVIYKPADELSETQTSIEPTLLLPDSRKDIQALSKSTDAYQAMHLSSKLSLLPKLNAFGNYELYDTEFLGTKAKGYTVGAQLSWSIFDGYSSLGKIEKAKAEAQKSSFELAQYKAKSQLELNSAWRNLTDLTNKVSLSKLALEQSQEAYKIKVNRFTQGLEKTTDLLNSETQVLQKELEHIQAVFELQVNQHYIQFLTN
ncbi:MAG: TolC family protein [Flavobacterium sp.]|nr:TolC family protein [Flavobacterium sp.]